MRPTLSAILLLALALLMLSSGSRADSSGRFIPCCRNVSARKIHVVKDCYEQKPRRNCNHAFLIINKRGRWCIRPDAAWLTAKIATGELHCPPDLSF